MPTKKSLNNYEIHEQTIHIDGQSIPLADILELGIMQKLEQLNKKQPLSHIKKQAKALAQTIAKHEHQSHSYLSYRDNVEAQMLEFQEQQHIYQQLQTDTKLLGVHVKYQPQSPLAPVATYLNSRLSPDDNQLAMEQLIQPYKKDLNITFEIEHRKEVYPLKQVKQQHQTTCGMACISMITNVPYLQVIRDARKIFHWSKNKKILATTKLQLIKLLSYYGFKGGKKGEVSDWNQCPDFCIVLINVNAKKRGHWVIFIRKDNLEYIIDPAHKDPIRTDLWKIVLHAYLEIDCQIF